MDTTGVSGILADPVVTLVVVVSVAITIMAIFYNFFRGIAFIAIGIGLIYYIAFAGPAEKDKMRKASEKTLDKIEKSVKSVSKSL